MTLIKQLEELEANVARTMAENEELKARQEKWLVKKTALENANAEFAIAFAEKEKELEELRAALEACRSELAGVRDREVAWSARIPRILALLKEGKPIAPETRDAAPSRATRENKLASDPKIVPLVPAPVPLTPPAGHGNGAAHKAAAGI